jgi:hypothetical protein
MPNFNDEELRYVEFLGVRFILALFNDVCNFLFFLKYQAEDWMFGSAPCLLVR